MQRKKITTSKSSSIRRRPSVKRSTKSVLVSRIAQSQPQKKLAPFILLFSSLALFSFFSIASAQGLLTRQAPQCSGVRECTSLYFKNLWQTLTSQPAQQSYALAENTVVTGTSVASVGSGKPLILQPNLNDFVGIGTLAPQAKLDVAGKAKVGTLLVDDTRRNGTGKIKALMSPPHTVREPQEITGLGTAFLSEVHKDDILVLAFGPSLLVMDDPTSDTKVKVKNAENEFAGVWFAQDSEFSIMSKNLAQFNIKQTNFAGSVNPEKSSIVVTHDGRIGIGTETPQAPLHVNGAHNYGIAIAKGSAGGNTIDGTVNNDVSAPLYLNAISGKDIYMVPSGGKVGIGTDNPINALDIVTRGRNLPFSGERQFGLNNRIVITANLTARTFNQNPPVDGFGSGLTFSIGDKDQLADRSSDRVGFVGAVRDVRRSSNPGSADNKSGSLVLGIYDGNTTMIEGFRITPKGFLPMQVNTDPAVTSLDLRDKGLTVYNTTENTYKVWNGSAWGEMGEDLWKKVGTTKDIYYTGGKVGIGTFAQAGPLAQAGPFEVRANQEKRYKYIGRIEQRDPPNWVPSRCHWDSNNDFYGIPSATVEVREAVGTHCYDYYVLNFSHHVYLIYEIVVVPALMVADDGNVGIGTATPNDKLTIQLPALATVQHGMSIDVESFGNITNAQNSYYFRTRDLGANSTAFYIRGDGSIGIGTATIDPGTLLAVSGRIESISNSLVGGNIVLTNPSKTSDDQAKKWTIYNMTGVYGDSLQFWNYNQKGCGGGEGSMCNNRLTISDSGNVGIGTGTVMPGASLQIAKMGNVTTGPCPEDSDWNYRTLESNAAAIKFFDDPASGCGDTAYIAYRSRGSTDKTSLIIRNANDPDDHIILKPSGNVGIGSNITDPEFKLDVEGDVNVRNPLALGKMDKYQKLAFASERIGFDVAELFDTEENVEVGEVLVVGSNERMLKKSSKSYQDAIIGVVSGAPAILFEGSQLKMGTSQKGSDNARKPAVALAGKVPVKVSLENGPIEVGDYLTTSNKPGMAMKATEHGMTLGIALENYNGKGKNEVLVFLSIKETNTSDIIEKLLNRIEKLEKSLRKK